MGINLAPLWEAPWFVQVHALTALAALMLGTLQFAAPKGTLPHRTLGGVWVVLMTAVTVSSAFILRPAEPGGGWIDRLSFLHIFTVVTAFGIVSGLTLLIRGGQRRKEHWKPFLGIYSGGLVVAGALAFLPGRVMHDVVFGGH